MNRILIFSCLVAVLSTMGVAYADTCTATLDKSTCDNGETITVTGVCNSGSEGNRAYSFQWWNVTGTVIMETDNGTTPSGTGTPFFASFVCPAVGQFDANVTLTGTNLEGGDTFSIVAASSNDLIIVNVSVTEEVLVGKTAGFKFTLIDKNNKKISQASCSADVEDGGGVPITAVAIDFSTHDGIGAFSIIASIDALSEGRQFVLDIRCDCGVANTSASCVDEDGLEVELSSGSIEFPFEVGSWLIVNTITDKDTYTPGEIISICANVTNGENRSRQRMIIDYDYRCDNGSAASFDRLLIDSYTEARGIDSNTTQNQCYDFFIPDMYTIELGATQCYADTRVVVLNEKNEFVVSYHTISPNFNISTVRFHPLNPNWVRTSRTSHRTNISLSDIDVGVRDIEVELNGLLSQLGTPATSIQSISVTLTDGSSVAFPISLNTHDKILTSGGNVEVVVIEISGVNTSLDQDFYVTVNFQGGEIMQISAVTLSVLAFAFFYVGGFFHREKEVPIRAGSIMVGVLLATNAVLISSIDTAEASPAVSLLIWVLRLTTIIGFLWVLFRVINTLSQGLSQDMNNEY